VRRVLQHYRLFTVVSTYKGHPYEATAFREGLFSSTYEAFFVAVDGSGCSGYMTIDLSVAEATSIYFGGETKVSSYGYSGAEGCAN
jgi:hypothetical protein